MKILASFLLSIAVLFANAQADSSTYLNDVKAELVKTWPKNHTINLVFHGHSVPSGYFNTPNVRTLDAYPYQVLKALKAKYPYAVVNSITTSIGGENSVSGEKRLKKDVLVHRPDVLFIDYALNDRYIVKNDTAASLRQSYIAMEKMVKAALKKHIKVILLTPSPDLRDSSTLLQHFTDQLIELAGKYNVGLVNSYEAFKGKSLKELMAQSNHPNERGHALIVAEIMKWF